MVEGGRRGPEFRGRRFEELKTPEQLSETLEEIDRLLGRLLEGGLEWDAQVRAARWQKILNLMQSIGIRGFDDLDGFTRAHQRTHDYWDFQFSRATWNKTPKGFSDPKGYFAALGVDPDSLSGKTESEIKTLLRQRYWELAKKHHPDLNRDSKTATEILKAINVAYEVLSDKKKREPYLRSE